jgi:hypothetical protein
MDGLVRRERQLAAIFILCMALFPEYTMIIDDRRKMKSLRKSRVVQGASDCKTESLAEHESSRRLLASVWVYG